MKSRIVLAILILLWMITVFCFSSDNSQESSSKSQKVVKVIVEVCNIKTTEEEELTIETIVRKCAHMIIYTIGGILIFLYCNTYDISLKKKILYTVIIGGLYAITDEIHQRFTPGRTPQITDVLIDTIGVNIRNSNKLLWIKNSQ